MATQTFTTATITVQPTRTQNSLVHLLTSNTTETLFYTRLAEQRKRLSDLLESKPTGCAITDGTVVAYIKNFEQFLEEAQSELKPDLSDDGYIPEILYIHGNTARKVSDETKAKAIAAAFRNKPDKSGRITLGAALEDWMFSGDFYFDDGNPKVDEFTIDASKMPAGPVSILLNDRSVLRIQHDGNYEFRDATKKKIARSRPAAPLEFNRYANASGLLEKFIAFCGSVGITINEFKALPIELFIVWLVQEAERSDGLENDGSEVYRAMKNVLQKKCLSCGRFISRKRSEIMRVCNDVCFDRLERKNSERLMIAA